MAAAVPRPPQKLHVMRGNYPASFRNSLGNVRHCGGLLGSGDSITSKNALTLRRAGASAVRAPPLVVSVTVFHGLIQQSVLGDILTALSDEQPAGLHSAVLITLADASRRPASRKIIAGRGSSDRIA